MALDQTVKEFLRIVFYIFFVHARVLSGSREHSIQVFVKTEAVLSFYIMKLQEIPQCILTFQKNFGYREVTTLPCTPRIRLPTCLNVCPCNTLVVNITERKNLKIVRHLLHNVTHETPCVEASWFQTIS